MATLGINDLKQYALPATWDAAYLRNLALEGGTTYDSLISEIAGALSVANSDLLSDPLYGGLTFSTQEATVEYRTGVSNGFELHTEYGTPDAKRGAVSAHMLPLLPYDRKFGWSWDFLRKARPSQIQADISSGLDDLKDRFQKSVLTRFFKKTYDAVGTGKSVPFADAGTADSTYVPIAVPERGGVFTSSHDHFKYLDGITQANLETAIGTLWEHGVDAPFDMVISSADIGAWSTIANVTGWKDKASAEIQYGSATNLARVDDSYIGAITTKYGAVRVRASGRVPTTYYGIYKSYGANDQRNPLYVRESPTYGLGAVLLAGDHIRQFPIENAIMFLEFGVGVGQSRVGAVACQNTSGGSYTTPTIA